MKKQKLILLLAIMTAFATALFLPGLVRADLTIIVDNPDAVVVPDPEDEEPPAHWSELLGYGFGGDCLYRDAGDGDYTVTWRPEIPADADFDYHVYAWWIEGGARATNAPYTIYYNGGSETVRVNQQETGTGGQWNFLGSYPFGVGTTGNVVLKDGPDADGAVVADAVKWFAVLPWVRDNSDDIPKCRIYGNWSTYSGDAPIYAHDCLYTDEDDSDTRVIWRPDIPTGEGGDYNVYAWWISGESRATNAKYSIFHADGTDHVWVNQRATSGQWNLLGTYPFAAGTSGRVRLTSGPGSNGTVIADAIMVIRGHIGTAQVEMTGQTTQYRAHDDGDLQKGVMWPYPRFTDNGNGTVTDNLTGLIWLKDANCADDEMDWNDAVDYCKDLHDECEDCGGDEDDCGLSDGSSAGDWRLPNVKELQSLIDYGHTGPAIPNTVGTGQWAEDDSFTDVESNWYWTSTTCDDPNTDAYGVNLSEGRMNKRVKTMTDYVWPVRDAQ